MLSRGFKPSRFNLSTLIASFVVCLVAAVPNSFAQSNVQSKPHRQIAYVASSTSSSKSGSNSVSQSHANVARSRQAAGQQYTNSPAVSRQVMGQNAGRGRSAVRQASVLYQDAPEAVVAAPEQVPAAEAPMAAEEMLAPMAMGYEGDCGCNACGNDVGCCCMPGGYLLDWSRCEMFVGMTSFANAGNFLTTGAGAAGQVEGSAGLQEGFNFGSRSPLLSGGQLGAQVGLRAIQAQLDGSASTPDSRNQLFATAGLFRRVDYGLQGGLVVDYFRDDWNYKADLLQLRGELSFLFTPCHDAGFRFTSSQRTKSVTAIVDGVLAPVTVKLAAVDTYRFFYRARFGHRGASGAELNAGFTENRDAVLGLNLTAPLQGSVGLQAGATYVIPRDTANPAYAFEPWNLGFSLVWTPGRGFGTNRDYFRPLFDVADNGSFITQRIP